MKYRHKKIKREHSIIRDALSWLEDLSRNPDVTDIIPGVISVTNSREKGVVYKYETATGCKLLLKSGGSIQEAFVVTKNPEVVKKWAAKIMEEISLIESSLDKEFAPEDKPEKADRQKTRKKTAPHAGAQKAKSDKVVLKSGTRKVKMIEPVVEKQDPLLADIKKDYKLVEINKGLRDSFVESLASMADLDGPKLEDTMDPSVRDKLKKLQKGLMNVSRKGYNKHGKRSKDAKRGT